MKESELKELINEHTNNYINNIAIELERPHNQWFENFGFPIFGETSKEYYEQVYFQSYLESYTRKMINGIFQDIFYDDVSDKIEWPEFEYKGIYNGFTNIEYEQEFGFEFINRDQEIGYRYTRFSYNKIDQLLTKGKVKAIVLILWQVDDVRFSYNDSRIKVVNLWELFQDLFLELSQEEISSMYQLFTESMNNAVELANSMISLTTIPGFTSSYLYKSREESVQILQKKAKTLSSFYVENANYKTTEIKSKQLIKDYNLSRYFLQNKMENAFVGSSIFAKSFLTSEYLFRYFKGNQMFDYTPIVSGYIKSIEQLLHKLCILYRNVNHIQPNMGNFTLGKYTDFIKNNERILRKELCPAKDIITSCLDSYRIESRNHLFHKDYFNNWERVERIRENTIFLYVILTGAVDINQISNDPIKDFGILNTEYNSLVRTLDNQTNHYISLILNGKLYSEAKVIQRKQGLVFDKNGLITNEIQIEIFSKGNFQTIVLSRRNIPSKIWIVDSNNRRTKQIWPV